MAREEEYTVEQIIETIKSTEGFLAMAAEKLGCTYQTIHNYQKKYPELDKAIKQIKERHLDFAEGKLLNNIKEGKETSLIFYLKTQGQNRGYVEKQQIEHSGMVSIESVIDTMDESQRERFISFLKLQSESNKD